MESTTAKRVPVLVADKQPVDARFVEKVCNYLDRIQDRITTKSEPRHIRFLSPRRPRISNTQAQVICAAFPTRPNEGSVLPRWIQDSVILWDRELIEAEVLLSSGLTVKRHKPQIRQCVSGYRSLTDSSAVRLLGNT